MRCSLEGALRRRRRALEAIHPHVRARKVVSARMLVLLDFDDIGRVGQQLIADARSNPLVHMLLEHLVLGMLAVTGRFAHGSLLVLRPRRSETPRLEETTVTARAGSSLAAGGAFVWVVRVLQRLLVPGTGARRCESG